MLTAIVLTILTAAPGAASKQGDSPSILMNPDTLITSPSGGIDDLRDAAREVLGLEGGHFAVAVKDFETGESFVETEGGLFDMGSPELIIASCAIDLDRAGVVSLDTMSSRDETVGDQIIMAREGDLDALNRITGRVRRPTIDSWLAQKGFGSTTYGGVQFLWAGAPSMDPNMSSPGDCMGMLSIIESRLDEAEIRRLVRNPFTRTELEELQGGSATIYGFCSRGTEGGRVRAAVIALPGDHRIGIVVLADQLCCEAKADLAFRMMWEALK